MKNRSNPRNCLLHLKVFGITVPLLLSCGAEKTPQSTDSRSLAPTVTSQKSEEESATEFFLASEREQSASFQRAMVSVAGSHFQSCAPMLYPNEPSKRMIRKFYGLEKSYTEPNQCRDRRSENLNYVSFGTGSYEPYAGRLALEEEQVNAFQRFNCSGFVAATMAAGGHKYYRGQESLDFSPRTHEINDIFNRADSCFYKPTLSKRVSLLPGDVINTSYGHVIRVLTVGKDPLGLRKIKRKSDCDKMKKRDLDFTFAHSTSIEKDGLKSGVRIEAAANATTSLVLKLVRLAKQMCKDNFEDGQIKGKIDDTQIGTKKVKFGPFTMIQDVHFSLRRHLGSTDAECSFEPAPVKGQSCLSESCFEMMEGRSFRVQ